MNHWHRYELTKEGSRYSYGDWRIEPANWVRPSPEADWDWWHDDFDGAPDSNDHRHGFARNLEACISEIHAWEDEQ